MLEQIADLSAVITAMVAFFGYGIYHFHQLQKRKRLVSYLKKEQEKGLDEGQRTTLHLMAQLGLTEAEILQASFRSKRIVRKIKKDDKTGLARELLFQWVGKA